MKTKENRVQQALDGCTGIGERRTIVHDKDGDVFGFGAWGKGSLTIVCAYEDPGNRVQTEEVTMSLPTLQRLLQWLEESAGITACSSCGADEWVKRGPIRVCLSCAIAKARRDALSHAKTRWKALSLGVMPDARSVEYTRWLESEFEEEE